MEANVLKMMFRRSHKTLTKMTQLQRDQNSNQICHCLETRMEMHRTENELQANDTEKFLVEQRTALRFLMSKRNLSLRLFLGGAQRYFR
jgi:hypothetical protein